MLFGTSLWSLIFHVIAVAGQAAPKGELQKVYNMYADSAALLLTNAEVRSAVFFLVLAQMFIAVPQLFIVRKYGPTAFVLTVIFFMRVSVLLSYAHIGFEQFNLQQKLVTASCGTIFALLLAHAARSIIADARKTAPRGSCPPAFGVPVAMYTSDKERKKDE
jgi:hypothetical protein